MSILTNNIMITIEYYHPIKKRFYKKIFYFWEYEKLRPYLERIINFPGYDDNLTKIWNEDMCEYMTILEWLNYPPCPHIEEIETFPGKYIKLF